jgi:hypothetical protein
MSSIGEKPVRLIRTTEGFARLPLTVPRSRLDSKLAMRLTEFVAFLQELEDGAALLRDDQLEQLIERALAGFGFDSLRHASSAMEWLFARPGDLS